MEGVHCAGLKRRRLKLKNKVSCEVGFRQKRTENIIRKNILSKTITNKTVKGIIKR